jgi:hypothetical protein
MNAVVDPGHRNLGLESDMANPNFAGARNPDDLLWVRFFVKSMQDNFQTTAQGRPIFRDETWIEIRTPGNALNIVERPVYADDKFRFPRHWAHFERTHGSDGQQVGTPLSQWPLLRPSQVQEMRALNFFTVEQVAMASDEQLQRLGMGPGIAPLALRERAKLYLENAKDAALSQKQAEEIKKRDEQIAQLLKDVAELKAAKPAEQTLHLPEKKKAGG